MSNRITTTGVLRKLGIDDRRELRYCSTVCRTYWDGIDALSNGGYWDEVHLDHDLHCWEDDREYTGYDVICWIELAFHEGLIRLPGKIECVSDNGPGRARIQQVIDKLYKKGNYSE